MRPILYVGCVCIGLFIGMDSCTKYDKVGIENYGNYKDTGTTLVSAATFPIGTAIDHVLMENNATYAATVTSNFNLVTFGNEFKEGSIVQLDGSKNYAVADALVNLCISKNLPIYGHNLAWYQQNNYSFLTGLAAALPSGNAINVLGPSGLNYNPDFDNGGSGTTPSTLAYWWFGSVGGGGAATFSLDNTTGNVEDGSASLKVVVTTPGTNAYNIQFINQDWKPATGQVYTITFWAKAAAAGGGFNVINQTPNSGSPNFSQQSISPTTAWTKNTWTYTAPANSIQFGFQFGTAGTYWIDNCSISVAPPTPPTGAALYKKVDSVFKDWITGMVGRYASSVHSWDVVNEPLNDDGSFRTGAPNPTNQSYYWGNILGRGYIDSAFVWAHASNSTADLFLNEYNLESSTGKLDSFIVMVNGLKSRGIPITGVGTEMHIPWNASYAGIDAAFTALASTGLKVRISELDIKINPQSSTGFRPTAEMEAYQADMYHYVVASYLKNVPKAQQFAITVWGVNDPNSWLYNNGKDYPLLFDSNYVKKPAFAGVLQALKGK